MIFPAFETFMARPLDLTISGINKNGGSTRNTDLWYVWIYLGYPKVLKT
jgi:hypothetical protein